MSALVNADLEDKLEAVNSTLLLFYTKNIGAQGSTAAETFGYFTPRYFSTGYYVDGAPSNYFNYAYAFSTGVINLKTGVLMGFDQENNTLSPNQLINLATQANQ